MFTISVLPSYQEALAQTSTAAISLVDNRNDPPPLPNQSTTTTSNFTPDIPEETQSGSPPPYEVQDEPLQSSVEDAAISGVPSYREAAEITQRYGVADSGRTESDDVNGSPESSFGQAASSDEIQRSEVNFEILNQASFFSSHRNNSDLLRKRISKQ